MLTVGSLFSGIGGLELGLERAGMRVEWQVENDSFCTKVLEKHWPHVTRHGDIRTAGRHNLSRVDVLAGGFPCQPHSVAGKRKASNDERNLWPEFYRIVCELKPQWVVAENVMGLLSSEHGKFFGEILRDLAAGGYDAEWDCLPAAGFGAPHIRESVFLLAYPDKIGRQRVLRKNRGNQTGGSHVGWTKKERCEGGESFSLAPRNCLSGLWAPQPGIHRVADGIPGRMDRLGSIGNAVVPQVAEYIGLCIIDENERCD